MFLFHVKLFPYTEIRKNAIQAFLEAKNIKTKYNLDSFNDIELNEEYISIAKKRINKEFGLFK